MQELIQRFVSELPSRIGAIREAIAANDSSRVATLAHQLRGAGGGYGFPQISAAAAEIESAASAGSLDLESKLAELSLACEEAARQIADD